MDPVLTGLSPEFMFFHMDKKGFISVHEVACYQTQEISKGRGMLERTTGRGAVLRTSSEDQDLKGNRLEDAEGGSRVFCKAA